MKTKFTFGILLPLAFCLITQESLQAQCSDWAVAALSNVDGGANCNGITIDPANNTYVTGYFNDDIKFSATDSLTAPADAFYSLFVVKYDPNGNAIWAKKAASNIFYVFCQIVYS